MNRRQLIAATVCTIGWPVAGLAQRTRSVPRIGFLGLGKPEDWTDQIEALRLGLIRFGSREGRNLLIEFRWAAKVSELDKFAEELSKLDVDIIVAPASTQVEPALRATRTIPIVFAQHADPVGIGHVASLAHPGGNVTGVSMVLTEMAAK